MAEWWRDNWPDEDDFAADGSLVLDSEPHDSEMRASNDPALAPHQETIAFLRENADELGVSEPHDSGGDMPS